MKKAIRYLYIFIFLIVFSLFLVNTTVADDQDLFTQGSSYTPNILIILDNSQSMDEDFNGNVVGPWATNSRLLEAKRAIQSIVDKYKSTMRIGLMTYKLNSVTAYQIHNNTYFTSYDPKSYCPNPPAECYDYCVTGDDAKRTTCQDICDNDNASFVATYLDEIITKYGVNTEQRKRYCNLIYPKKQRFINPTDTSNYVYYKIPGTLYSTGNWGNSFCYSKNYNADENVNDRYNCYHTKLGTDDGTYEGANPGQYSSKFWDNIEFGATDEDVALGYKDFGRRNAWYHVGQSWFAESSPGGGFLHVAADTDSTTHYSALTAKLALHESDMAGYMNSSQCSSSKSNSCPFIVNAGLTPIAGTLQSAIDYYKGTLSSTANYTNKSIASPIQDSCQKNFVIFVTDGLPSIDKNGNKGSATALMPDVLAKIDALRALTKTITVGGVDTEYTFNILTYVVGMAMTSDAKPHLDTMASRGGTAVNGQALYADNPSAIYSQLDTILSDITTRAYAFATSSISSSRTADENFIYEATFEPVGNNYPFWKGYLKKWSLKTDGSLDNVVWQANAQMPAASARIMKTLIGGSLVNFKYANEDAGATPVAYGKMGVTDQATADKIIKYVRGYAVDPVDGVTVTNPDNWTLGDTFHSSPITLGTPTPFFNDLLETNPAAATAPKRAFDLFREAHPRASQCPGGVMTCAGYGKRMIISGANDGQFHAFNATTGAEFWSFVPPNLLPKLQYFAHYTTTATSGHHFFVDGPTTATDAWLPTAVSNGATKDPTDWRTLVMFSLGRNDRDYTTADMSAVPTTTKYWSSSASCDSGLAEYYDAATAPYYCGYYAFDFTNAPTTLPSFKWTLTPGATTESATRYAAGAPYLAEPWSAVSVGRVKIDGNERWIGVIGGGYNAANCGTSTCSDKRGKGIIVFDMRNGETLWSYKWNATDAANIGHPDMGYAIPSQMALVDSDFDGLLDRGFVGDIKGNVWQIKFCSKANYAADANCGVSSWKGSLLLDKLSGSDKYPVYKPPTVTRDSSNNLWIFWSSGDMVDPTGTGPAAYVYGLKPLRCQDTDGNPVPCLRSNLENITSSKSTYCGATDKWGWYINLSGKNEQVLSQPVAFNNVLYFTSFIPASGSSASCTKTGTAQLYGIGIDSGTACNVGAGIFTGGSRFITVGAGIASNVLLSYNPGGGLVAFVTVSGSGGQQGGTLLAPFTPPALPTRSNMLYWKDRRIQ